MSTDATHREHGGPEQEHIPDTGVAPVESANETPFFPIGEAVRLWRGVRDPHEGPAGRLIDTTHHTEKNEWRVAGYDAVRRVYTLEFLGAGGGTYEATEEQLLKYNPERGERIKQKMNEPPDGTVH